MVPYVLDTIEVPNTPRRADARIIMLSQLSQNLLRAKFDIINIIHDIEKIRTDGHGRDVQQTTLSPCLLGKFGRTRIRNRWRC